MTARIAAARTFRPATRPGFSRVVSSGIAHLDEPGFQSRRRTTPPAVPVRGMAIEDGPDGSFIPKGQLFSGLTMHNRCVRRTWLKSLGSGLLLCVLTIVTVLTLNTQDSSPTADATVLARAGAEDPRQDEKGGPGPPPWASAGGANAKRGNATDSWKDDWRALTPAQKTQTMASLARAHEDGMRNWTLCVRAAGTDAEKRRTCEKPLPPGLAKKQL